MQAHAGSSTGAVQRRRGALKTAAVCEALQVLRFCKQHRAGARVAEVLQVAVRVRCTMVPRRNRLRKHSVAAGGESKVIASGCGRSREAAVAGSTAAGGQTQHR